MEGNENYGSSSTRSLLVSLWPSPPVETPTGRNPHRARPPPPPSAGGGDSDIAVNMEVSDQNCKSYNTIYVFN